MSVSVSKWGEHDGKIVDLFRIENANGLVATVTNYACAVTELVVPDRHGRPGDVVLGYDSLDGYLGDTAHLGAVVGRYGNRIAKGRFEIDGSAYELATNNGPNHLHGGVVGFDRRVWDATVIENGVEMRYVSPDGEEGYPGTLSACVRTELTEDDELRFTYHATTDATTHVNLTNHSYFNLAGSGDILDHEVRLQAEHFTPTDEGLIPTGELRPVDDSPFDFRECYRIGDRIEAPDAQLEAGGGYDHNFALNRSGDALEEVVTVIDPLSGRQMHVLTTEPGVQFYTGNFLDGTIVGKAGARYARRSGLCLETQHFPDSPNQPDFPTTLLHPGETYRTTTVYRFDAV
jgi:aldose 1-epimerase